MYLNRVQEHGPGLYIPTVTLDFRLFVKQDEWTAKT